MRRCDFVGGYSVMVFAGDAMGAPARTMAASGAVKGDAHMAMVELDTDIVVAGGGVAGGPVGARAA